MYLLYLRKLDCANLLPPTPISMARTTDSLDSVVRYSALKENFLPAVDKGKEIYEFHTKQSAVLR